MQNIDLTAQVKKVISFSLVGIIALAMIIGYGEYKYWHKDETLTFNDAKVAGTMVSVRVLANGKVSERLFEDGAEVKAGDVIARLEVAITEEEIQQLEDTVQLAKDNYAELQMGQTVTVPVQRERVVYPPAPPPTVRYEQAAPSGNLAKLEERANRMAELFEMGAVSAVERDKAQRAYESALAESQSSTAIYEYSAAPEPIIEYYTEYVEEFRPTPPEVLEGAAQAIKQAELSLNVARQEARETDVIAPVSGTIYYGADVEQNLSAGESIAKIGDSRELWIEVEVSEEIFDKIPLGKLATYSIDGKEFAGTVIEKIRPTPPEPDEENQETLELPEIPTTENQPGALISDNPPEGETPPKDETTPEGDAAQSPENQTPPENNTPNAENQPAEEPPQIVEAEVEIIDGEKPADSDAQPTDNPTPADSDAQPTNNPTPADSDAQPTDNPTPTDSDAQPTDNPTPAENNAKPKPPKFLTGTEAQPRPNDKFIIKISLPADRDFECSPNTTVVVKIKI